MEMAGILSNLISMMQVGNRKLPIRINQVGNNAEIVIEFTEKEFKDMVFQNMPEQQRNAVNVVFEQGKMKIIIKLW